MTATEAPLRRCACGTVLSAYNSSDTCWPCIDRQNMADTLPKKPKEFGRHAADIAMEYRHVLNAARTMPGAFKAHDLMTATGLSVKVIAAHLIRAGKAGRVVRAGEETVRYRGAGSRVTEQRVVVWKVP